MIDPAHAVILGVVEGLTEFLPVSSTGHLILASRLMGLRGEAVDAFTVVIQAGALLAVIGLYRARVLQMMRGLFRGHVVGRSLFINLMISFLPSAVTGLLLHRTIKERLFGAWPVAAALAAGGIAMIAVDRWLRGKDDVPSVRTIDSISALEALTIGLAQCLSLWPGTSRAMVTLVAGLLCGLPAAAAAEYSFLLALPTLGAAVLFDALSAYPQLWRETHGLSLLLGLLTAAVVAALAVKVFIAFLSRNGLEIFGWYRLLLAAAVWLFI